MKCPVCKGSGINYSEIRKCETDEWLPVWRCALCNGTGRVSFWLWARLSAMWIWEAAKRL